MGEWSISDRQELELDRVTEMRIEVTLGEVSVTAGPAPARLEVEWQGGRPVEVRHEDGRLQVLHRVPRIPRISLGHNSERCLVRLVVPAGVPASVSVVGASAVVSGMTAHVEVTSVSGHVYLHELGGEVAVRTVNGAIDATGLDGDVVARTVSGPLTVGEVRAPSVEAHTVSGDIVIDCVRQPTRLCSLTTVSGEATVRMPPQLDADIRLRSVTGKITTTFALDGPSPRQSRVTRELTGRSGAGGLRVEVVSVSGRVALLEGRAPA